MNSGLQPPENLQIEGVMQLSLAIDRIDGNCLNYLALHRCNKMPLPNAWIFFARPFCPEMPTWGSISNNIKRLTMPWSCQNLLTHKNASSVPSRQSSIACVQGNSKHANEAGFS